MAWYDSAVFYHIYPLGLCGCAKENNRESENHFDKLTQWADHVKKMECTAIYIGPLFESGSHGYDTTDYRMVDRRIGTNADFKKWVSYCHNIGLKVIVDGVFNHTGRQFFAFEDIKQNRENSRYRDWYCNVNFGGNNEYNDGFCYDNWGGYNLLAKLNLRNPEVRNYHFDTIRFWINEFDIDGIRLDAADVLDFDFMSELRHVADELKPEFWLMGEVIHGDYSRWANNNMLYSVTNYELHKGLFSGHNDHNYFEIAHSIKRLNDICRGIRLYTFVDNHDVERIASKLNNKAHLYNIGILLYTVPGIPSIYYGSEFSIEGRKENGSDWGLRPCLNLDDFKNYYTDNEVTRLYIQLGKLKKQFPELTYGEYKELQLTNRQFAFARILDGKAVIVALNNDDNAAHMEIGLPVQASQAVDLLANDIADKQETEETAPDTSKIIDSISKALADTDSVADALNAMKSSVESDNELNSKPQDILNLVHTLETSCNDIFKASGIDSTPSSDHGDLGGYPQCNLDNNRLIIDLPANKGTVILVQ
ncbi:MAG: alpha-amylase family glycosyl hydrolase [Lachnospiraceae bacterium]|nr:alpha-amylase family glycosyl hydrolase [Lachnospiraceae bacterium]